MALKLASMRNRSPCQNPEKDAENAQEEQSKEGRELHPYRRFTEKCRYKPYLPSLIMASARLVVIWVLQTPLKQGWRPWWCQPPGMWSASPSTWHRERTWRDLSWSVNPLQFSYQTWELKPCLHPPAFFSDDSAIIGYISKAEEAMTGSFIIWRKHKHLQLIVTKTKELCPSRGVIVDIVEDYTWECTLTIICDLRTRSSFPLISNRNWSHSTAITCLTLAHLNSLPSYSTVHSCVQHTTTTPMMRWWSTSTFNARHIPWDAPETTTGCPSNCSTLLSVCQVVWVIRLVLPCTFITVSSYNLINGVMLWH